MLPLNSSTCPRTPRPERIVQFGEGNFLRAFVDWMVARMNATTDFNGSVVVVKPTPRPSRAFDTLRRQDCLYHVNLQGLDHGEAVNSVELVDVLSRAIDPYADPDAYAALAAAPSLRFVVSNTTEAGIVFDPACQLHDAPAASYPAKLTQLLFRRYQAFGGAADKGLVIMPCELVMHNGTALTRCIEQYIALWQLGDGFAQWFRTACTVCNTLVDRIVPGFPKQDIGAICARAGYDDQMAVQAEVFHLWVIEGPQTLAKEFPAAEAGLHVLFTDNETPYHARKLTLLNAPHTVLAPVALMAGIDIVRDACHDPLIGRYLRHVMCTELAPTLPMPLQEATDFADSVWQRFCNPFVNHALQSIMLNAVAKFRARELTALKAHIAARHTAPKGLTLGLAALVSIYNMYTREDGTVLRPNDAPEVVARVQAIGQGSDAARALLADTALWGEDLNALPTLTETLARMLEGIRQRGIKAMVEEMVCAQ